MIRSAVFALSLFAAIGTATTSAAQQTGSFAVSPLAVSMIDPGPSFGFEYAYVDIDMIGLNPTGDVYTLEFANTFGLNIDIYVTETIPYWGPNLSWPFAPVGGTTSVSVGILIINHTKSNGAFFTRLLDDTGGVLDSGLVALISP